jgi:hydroperoxide dehydratase
MAMSKNDNTEELSQASLPIKPIPGSYGIPILSPIYDRLHYYYFQGHMEYFKSHMNKYNSTVVRLNMIPGPFLARTAKVVAVMDAKSYRVLFDTSKVEKKNSLTMYMPSLSLYSGIRPLAFLDTTEELHSSLKSYMLHMLASRKAHVIPSFQKAYRSVFDTVEQKLSSGPVEFNSLSQPAIFDFMCNALLGAVPSEVIGPSASNKAGIWLLLQLHPLMSRLSKFIPWPIDDLILHSFPLPTFLGNNAYKTLEEFFSKNGESLLKDAEENFGLSRHETLHNLIFMALLNGFSALKIFMPVILKWLTHGGGALHSRLAHEVRSAVQSSNGTITIAALEKMELTKSVVWEALRLDPPVDNQYGTARTDLVIESHDATFKVKKGEIICGYQPLAMRDEKVFANAEEFVPDRFVGDQGKRLLEYVYWSNGPESGMSAVDNKQCPGKDLVILAGRFFVAELFLRYDTFSAMHDGLLLGIEPKIVFKSVSKASYP